MSLRELALSQVTPTQINEFPSVYTECEREKVRINYAIKHDFLTFFWGNRVLNSTGTERIYMTWFTEPTISILRNLLDCEVIDQLGCYMTENAEYHTQTVFTFNTMSKLVACLKIMGSDPPELLVDNGYGMMCISRPLGHIHQHVGRVQVRLS